jgi:hypothetical protein
MDAMPLIALIQSTIAPGTWLVVDESGQEIMSETELREDGDRGESTPDRKPGKITSFSLSLSLIIRHDAEVHDQLAGFIRKLRAAFTPPIDEATTQTGATLVSSVPSSAPKAATSARSERRKRIVSLLEQLQREIDGIEP